MIKAMKNRHTELTIFDGEINYMEKILVNIICCKKYGNIIESTHLYDFKFCRCGAVAVGREKDYLHRCGNRKNWEKLSKYSNL